MSSQYKIYNSLHLRLRRAGFHSKGLYSQFSAAHLTNYLCFLYIKKNGVVYKEDLIKYKIIHNNENTTNELLKFLVKTNFILWDINENKEKNLKIYQTFASIKLIDLIEKEVIGEKSTKKDIAILQSEIESLKKVIIGLISIFDPPVNQDKIKKYKELLKNKLLKSIKEEDGMLF